MALPNTKVEIAFNAGYGTPAASRVWTDVSAYVEASSAIGITRGRADETSQVQPSRVTVTLNNADGRFTPRLATGAYYPNVKKWRPIRITSTYNAVNYTRFTGYVVEWPVSWPDGSSAVSEVTITCVSRMARLGRGGELRSIVEQEILKDSPVAYYTLSEPAEATQAGDTSGSQQPNLTPTGTGTAVAFGTATGPGTDGLTAAQFAGGQYLQASLQFGSTPSAVVVEFFFTATTSAQPILRFLTSDALIPAIGITSNQLALTNGGARSLGGTSVIDGAVHHGLLILTSTSTTLYCDGSTLGPTAIIPFTPASGLTVEVGGISGPSGTYGTDFVTNSFTGSLAHVAVYTTSLSSARALAHANAGLNGFAGEASAARITRLAGYANIASAELSLDAGLATIGFVDTTGKTPIALMQDVVTTENGVLYDARDGSLVFKERDARYNAASAFTLNATSQEVEADLEPKDDDQFLVNDVSATANGVPAGRVFDQTSIDDNGYYRESLDTVTDSTADALYGAQWKVSLGKDPEPRYTTVTVDITNASTSQAAAVLSAEIGTCFTLAGLPAQAPASSVDLFVEGYTESITGTSHRITFNTSPANGYSGTNGVWQLGVAGRSELGVTTRLAY